MEQVLKNIKKCFMAFKKRDKVILSFLVNFKAKHSNGLFNNKLFTQKCDDLKLRSRGVGIASSSLGHAV